jgi:hypothetical protein
MLVKVLRGDSLRELELSGTRSELLALAGDLRSGRAEVRVESVPDPSPYDRSLSLISIRPADGKVRIGCFEDGAVMEVLGAVESLAVLAENIECLTRQDDPGHLHVDYHPEHYYLTEGSESLVVTIEDDNTE